MKFWRKRDPDESPIFGTHPGDLGVVVMAALLSICFLYLLIAPDPLAVFNHPAAAAKPAKIQQKPETEMMLYPAKR
jgi:hypothetical protein